MITRARVVDAVSHVLAERGSRATADTLSTARAVADRLGLRRDTPTEPPGPIEEAVREHVEKPGDQP